MMTSKAGLLRSKFQKAGRKAKLLQATQEAFKSVVNIPPKDSGAFLSGFPKDLGIAKQEEGAPELQKWLGLIRKWLGELLGVGSDIVAVRVKKVLEAHLHLARHFASCTRFPPPRACVCSLLRNRTAG